MKLKFIFIWSIIPDSDPSSNRVAESSPNPGTVVKIAMSLAYAAQQIGEKSPEREDFGARSVTLDRLPVGASGRVVAVRGSGPVARRLLEMGVVPGAPVRVVKFAPLGDPLEVRVRDYHLALRRSEAETIIVMMNAE